MKIQNRNAKLIIKIQSRQVINQDIQQTQIDKQDTKQMEVDNDNLTQTQQLLGSDNDNEPAESSDDITQTQIMFSDPENEEQQTLNKQISDIIQENNTLEGCSRDDIINQLSHVAVEQITKGITELIDSYMVYESIDTNHFKSIDDNICLDPNSGKRHQNGDLPASKKRKLN